MTYQALVFDGEDSSLSPNASLYLYNGTAVTVLMPTDAFSNGGGAGNDLSPAYFAQFGTQLVFGGVDASGYADLWVSDGTNAGTAPVVVSNADPGLGLYPTGMTTFDNAVYFNGIDNTGNNDLWAYNGTTASIVNVPNAGPNGLNPEGLVASNGVLYFYGSDSAGNTQVYAFNGTTATALTSATDTSNYALTSGPNGASEFIAFKQGVLFVAAESTDTYGLYYSTGTLSGTTEVLASSSALFTGLDGLQAPLLSGVQAPFTTAGGGTLAVFDLPGEAASAGSGLWVTNGTAAGTTQLGPIANTSPDGFDPTGFTDYNGKVYFSANDASGLTGLWVTDGTAAGTKEIIPAGASTDIGLDPTQFAVEGGQLYFSGLDASDNADLWVTDGTAANTQIVAGSIGTSPYDVFAASLVACYCKGTLISTGAGQTPVEALSIGDLVLTASGALQPIRWIGHRSYAGRFLAGRRNLLPILIRSGALGNGLPRRDLRISPSHAMFIDGLLIPARELVNGTTIVQDLQCKRVDYFHIELAEHDVILAEGAPSETFLDDDSRGMFHNAGEFAALYPAAVASGQYCAPRVESGYGLEAIRVRLAGLSAAA